MNLIDVKLNTDCMIKQININDEKTKIRLMELGLILGCKLRVGNKSMLKQTLLIEFNSSCFTLKSDIAKMIVVNYV